MFDVTLGHGIACTLLYLDQKGNPMLAVPKPDAPPVWTQTTPATETIAVNPDGSECDATTVAVGTDTISVSVTVGGAVFSASLDVSVDAVPQVLTSVAIAPAVV